MPYSKDYIKEKLEKELEPLHLEVEDDSDGCGAKFSVVVVSEKFQGKPLLWRHRLINGILEEELKTIHAFSQKCLSPDQWQQQQQQQKA